MATKFELPSPAVVVDLDIAERNIARVADLARQNGKKLRPHIKPHKSTYFARQQLAAGAQGITVAKISEAEVMAAHGITDILIAYSLVGDEKLARLKRLHERAQIVTTVDGLEVARGLATVGSTERPLPVLIEIDSGTHRGGCQPGQAALALAQQVRTFPSLHLQGLFTYGGNIYGSRNRAELAAHAAAEAGVLRATAALLEQNGIPVSVLSGGSTPATVVLDKLEGVTEIRPGNYVFFDVSGLNLGIATVNDCALRVLATVVSVPLPGYATIDAGSKALTSDPAERSQEYGYLVDLPDVHLVKLNEEHGYLRYDPAQRELHVGDRIEIIPNHACVVPNLSGVLYGVRGGKVEREIAVEARGKNY
ncbi:MAG TPA: amino acid processing protein [Thermoanaerobacterium sp.]|nr:amino acid processing protein [Thermoanaerobacterium sp.]